jgi:hypothetical protein
VKSIPSRKVLFSYMYLYISTVITNQCTIGLWVYLEWFPATIYFIALNQPIAIFFRQMWVNLLAIRFQYTAPKYTTIEFNDFNCYITMRTTYEHFVYDIFYIIYFLYNILTNI